VIELTKANKARESSTFVVIIHPVVNKAGCIMLTCQANTVPIQYSRSLLKLAWSFYHDTFLCILCPVETATRVRHISGRSTGQPSVQPHPQSRFARRHAPAVGQDDGRRNRAEPLYRCPGLRPAGGTRRDSVPARRRLLCLPSRGACRATARADPKPCARRRL